MEREIPALHARRYALKLFFSISSLIRLIQKFSSYMKNSSVTIIIRSILVYYTVYIKELESDEKHRICVVNVI